MGRYICAISEDPDDMISASCDVLLKVCNVYRLFNNITAVTYIRSLITATRVATYNLRQCRSEYVFARRESLKNPVDLDLHCFKKSFNLELIMFSKGDMASTAPIYPLWIRQHLRLSETCTISTKISCALPI